MWRKPMSRQHGCSPRVGNYMGCLLLIDLIIKQCTVCKHNILPRRFVTENLLAMGNIHNNHYFAYFLDVVEYNQGIYM